MNKYIKKLKLLFRKIFPLNTGFMNSYSQDGEDLILWSFLKYRKNGYYIDIGAHHPKRFSNTYKFYRAGWKGINIDPTPGSMKLFNKLRPLDTNIEVGVSDEPGEIELYMFNEPALNSFDKKLSLSRHDSNESDVQIIDTKSIEVVTLNSIIEKYVPSSVSEIDFLSIDVEGFDFNVINSLDLEKYKPYIIAIEIIELKVDDVMNSNISIHLGKYGYSIIDKCKRTVFFCNV